MLVKNMSASSRAGLEQDDVGVLVLDVVLGQAGLHARMDDGAEGLRQDHRQAAIDQLALPAMPFVRGMPGIEGHQRIDAEHQPRAFLERDGRMQRLLQRAVDIPAAVDLDRRVQPGQRGAGLDRGGRSAHGRSPSAPKATARARNRGR
jgi:hypothetical protein